MATDTATRPDTGPLLGLRLVTPRLELRLGDPEQLVALGHLAEQGIHPADQMPFVVPWTDRVGQPDFVDSLVEFHRNALTEWRPESWRLRLLVWAKGSLAGTQDLTADDFSTRRTVETGSWLGQAFQGRGLGTEMRAAVLELAFSGLGARAALSGAIADNAASLRVSEKLGYTITGTRSVAPRGQPVPHRDLRLERAAWRCPVGVRIEGLDPCRPLFGAGA